MQTRLSFQTRAVGTPPENLISFRTAQIILTSLAIATAGFALLELALS